MIKTVIFDLDDTLYDEIEYCRSGFRAVAKFLAENYETKSKPEIFALLWQIFLAGNRTKTFNAIIDRLGLLPASDSKTLIDDLIKVYRNHTPQINLPVETGKVLKLLRANYALALLTDGYLPAQELKVKALAIESYFDRILYTEQLGRQYWKPSPVGFTKLLDTLNTKLENAAYVADNPKKDFIAPNKLGMVSIQLIRPARLHTESTTKKNAAAKYVIQQIIELPDLLQKL